MCVGPFRPKRQAAPAPDPVVQQQAEEAQAKATEKAKTRKQEALEQTLTRIRGGRGRRSLITGSRGGMGFYNEYMD